MLFSNNYLKKNYAFAFIHTDLKKSMSNCVMNSTRSQFIYLFTIITIKKKKYGLTECTVSFYYTPCVAIERKLNNDNLL